MQRRNCLVSTIDLKYLFAKIISNYIQTTKSYKKNWYRTD